MRQAVWIGLAAGVLVGAGACRSERTEPADPTTQESDAMATLTVESEAFDQGEKVPRKYTEDGQNVSPPLKWSGVPEGTQALALIMDDPDAPVGTWVHWVLYNLPAETRSLPERVPPSGRVSEPGGALQGKNSWGRTGYGGPAPPKGHGVHHYHFKVYALDTPVELVPGASKEALLAAMAGHIVAQGDLVGTYQR